MKKHILLVVLQLAASGADAYFTNRDMDSHHARELNPIAAPWVNSTGTRVTYFSLTTTAKLGTVELLRAHHHDKLADTLAVAGIVDNALGASISATHPPYPARTQ